MLQMAHIGLYVKDINLMSDFYKSVFQMHVICEKTFQSDALIQNLLGNDSAGVIITKLITDQGKMSGIDDMLELLQVKGAGNKQLIGAIYQPGCMHIGFRVDDIDKTIDKIIEYGGSKYTDIHTMPNGNRCCFARDIENNWLELIERH